MSAVCKYKLLNVNEEPHHRPSSQSPPKFSRKPNKLQQKKQQIIEELSDENPVILTTLRRSVPTLAINYMNAVKKKKRPLDDDEKLEILAREELAASINLDSTVTTISGSSSSGKKSSKDSTEESSFSTNISSNSTTIYDDNSNTETDEVEIQQSPAKFAFQKGAAGLLKTKARLWLGFLSKDAVENIRAQQVYQWYNNCISKITKKIIPAQLPLELFLRNVYPKALEQQYKIFQSRYSEYNNPDSLIKTADLKAYAGWQYKQHDIISSEKFEVDEKFVDFTQRRLDFFADWPTHRYEQIVGKLLTIEFLRKFYFKDSHPTIGRLQEVAWVLLKQAPIDKERQKKQNLENANKPRNEYALSTNKVWTELEKEIDINLLEENQKNIVTKTIELPKNEYDENIEDKDEIQKANGMSLNLNKRIAICKFVYDEITKGISLHHLNWILYADDTGIDNVDKKSYGKLRKLWNARYKDDEKLESIHDNANKLLDIFVANLEKTLPDNLTETRCSLLHYKNCHKNTFLIIAKASRMRAKKNQQVEVLENPIVEEVAENVEEKEAEISAEILQPPPTQEISDISWYERAKQFIADNNRSVENDINLSIQPRDHQLNVIKNVENEDGMIINHSTGSGKSILAVLLAYCFLTNYFNKGKDKVKAKIVYITTLGLTQPIREKIKKHFRYVLGNDTAAIFLNEVHVIDYATVSKLNKKDYRFNRKDQDLYDDRTSLQYYVNSGAKVPIMLILDEVHNVRNEKGINFDQLRDFAEREECIKRILMSASPFVNQVENIIPLWEIVWRQNPKLYLPNNEDALALQEAMFEYCKNFGKTLKPNLENSIEKWLKQDWKNKAKEYIDKWLNNSPISIVKDVKSYVLSQPNRLWFAQFSPDADKLPGNFPLNLFQLWFGQKTYSYFNARDDNEVLKEYPSNNYTHAYELPKLDKNTKKYFQRINKADKAFVTKNGFLYKENNPYVCVYSKTIEEQISTIKNWNDLRTALHYGKVYIPTNFASEPIRRNAPRNAARLSKEILHQFSTAVRRDTPKNTDDVQYGGAVYNDAFEQNARRACNAVNLNEFFIKDAVQFLEKPSVSDFRKNPKFAFLYKVLSRHPNLPESKRGGKIVIYSQWILFGTDIIKLFIDRYNEEAAAKNSPKYPTIIITGETNPQERENTVAQWNRNLNPETNQILIISSVGSEGFDLKATKQVIIFEPQWNEATTAQIVGRAIRYHSHINLEGGKPYVDISILVWDYLTSDLSKETLLCTNILFPKKYLLDHWNEESKKCSIEYELENPPQIPETCTDNEVHLILNILNCKNQNIDHLWSVFKKNINKIGLLNNWRIITENLEERRIVLGGGAIGIYFIRKIKENGLAYVTKDKELYQWSILLPIEPEIAESLPSLRGKKIIKGGYGRVLIDENSDEVIKMPLDANAIRNSDFMEEVEALKNEINLSQTLRNCYISNKLLCEVIEIRHIYIKKPYVWLTMPKLDSLEELRIYIHENAARLGRTENAILMPIMNVTSGYFYDGLRLLETAAKYKIRHRDIKIENLLWNKKNNKIVISDWGMSCIGICGRKDTNEDAEENKIVMLRDHIKDLKNFVIAIFHLLRSPKLYRLFSKASETYEKSTYAELKALKINGRYLREEKFRESMLRILELPEDRKSLKAIIKQYDYDRIIQDKLLIELY